jgi:hypothetical protein
MNLQALFDGVLAAVALWVAWGPGRRMPALRLGAILLGLAALLGTLRFSGLLPLPKLHQSMSMLGAGVGLPLLGVAMVWPAGAVARQRRYAWIFGVVAAVLCMLIGVLAGVALWPSACALLAVLAILGSSLARRQWIGAAAATFMLAGLLAFVIKWAPGPLLPGDMLHIGLAAGLALYGSWAARA